MSSFIFNLLVSELVLGCSLYRDFSGYDFIGDWRAFLFFYFFWLNGCFGGKKIKYNKIGLQIGMVIADWGDFGGAKWVFIC